MQAMAASAQTTSYEPLTPLMAVRLAAPHTWPGPAVLTTVFGGVYAIACGYVFSPVIWCLLLAVAVFAQSAVNTLNDWADYRAGTDTVENSDDPTDAVLVYNNPNPRSVLALGLVYMLVALVWRNHLRRLVGQRDSASHRRRRRALHRLLFEWQAAHFVFPAR